MKAAILKGPSQLVIENIPDPTPSDNDLLVKVKYCGICGSDLHIYESPNTPPGHIMGHEFACEVVEVGSNVRDFSVGDRVWPSGFEPEWIWKPEHGWDLKAWAHDDFVKKMGGYGEYILRAPESMAIIPDQVSYEEACMLDPVSSALAGLHHAKLQIGESVLIIGAGPLGLLAIRLCQLAGASKICVLEISEGRAQFARKMNPNWVLNPLEPDVRERITELFDGFGPDVVLDYAGSQGAVQMAIETVRVGGRIALVALNFEDIKVNTMKMFLKGVSMYSVLDLDYGAGAKLITQKMIDPTEIISAYISLEQLPEAFERLLHPKDEVKILVQYD
jgi:2-desacetyl-2-hydroxyethyl bacteriochlorophyllide A dehydrogenase